MKRADQPRPRSGPPDPALVELVRALARKAARRDDAAERAQRARKREGGDSDDRPASIGV